MDPLGADYVAAPAWRPSRRLGTGATNATDVIPNQVAGTRASRNGLPLAAPDLDSLAGSLSVLGVSSSTSMMPTTTTTTPPTATVLVSSPRASSTMSSTRVGPPSAQVLLPTSPSEPSSTAWWRASPTTTVTTSSTLTLSASSGNIAALGVGVGSEWVRGGDNIISHNNNGTMLGANKNLNLRSSGVHVWVSSNNSTNNSIASTSDSDSDSSTSTLSYFSSSSSRRGNDNAIKSPLSLFRAATAGAAAINNNNTTTTSNNTNTNNNKGHDNGGFMRGNGSASRLSSCDEDSSGDELPHNNNNNNMYSNINNNNNNIPDKVSLWLPDTAPGSGGAAWAQKSSKPIGNSGVVVGSASRMRRVLGDNGAGGEPTTPTSSSSSPMLATHEALGRAWLQAEDSASSSGGECAGDGVLRVPGTALGLRRTGSNGSDELLDRNKLSILKRRQESRRAFSANAQLQRNNATGTPCTAPPSAYNDGQPLEVEPTVSMPPSPSVMHAPHMYNNISNNNNGFIPNHINGNFINTNNMNTTNGALLPHDMFSNSSVCSDTSSINNDYDNNNNFDNNLSDTGIRNPVAPRLSKATLARRTAREAKALNDSSNNSSNTDGGPLALLMPSQRAAFAAEQQQSALIQQQQQQQQQQASTTFPQQQQQQRARPAYKPTIHAATVTGATGYTVAGWGERSGDATRAMLGPVPGAGGSSVGVGVGGNVGGGHLTSTRSLVEGNARPVEETPVDKLQPCSSPDVDLRSALECMTKANAARYATQQQVGWELHYEAIDKVRRVNEHHPEALLGMLAPTLVALAPAIDNLRSYLAKNAIVALREMFARLGKAMDAHLPAVVPAMLGKSADTSGAFLAAEVDRALMDMVECVTDTRALAALAACCGHRSPQVRAKVAQHVDGCIQRMGGVSRVISSSSAPSSTSATRDLLDKLFLSTSAFLDEGGVETRIFAKRILFEVYRATVSIGEWDRLLRRLPSEGKAKQVRSAVENLSELPQPPRKVVVSGGNNVGSGSGSASVPASLTTLNRLPKPPGRTSRGSESDDGGSPMSASSSKSNSSSTRRLSNQNGVNAGVRRMPSELSTQTTSDRECDAAVAQLPGVLSSVSSTDWKERLSGIEQLAGLVADTPAVLEARMGAIVEGLIARAADGNAKVAIAAVAVLGELFPLLGDAVAPCLHALVPALASALCSANDKIAAAASAAFTSLMERVEASLLVQYVAHSVSHGGVRARPLMLERLDMLVAQGYERKPALVMKYALPAVLALLNEPKGEVRSLSIRLLHKLARLMGSGPVLDCAGTVSVTMQARVAEVLSGNGYS